MRWEKLTVCCPQALTAQTSKDQKVDDAPYYLTTNQSQNVYELITPSSLNHCNKTHYPLQVGIDSFEGISWLYPPSPGKAIKIFFSTSSQTCLHISIWYKKCTDDESWLHTPTISSLQIHLDTTGTSGEIFSNVSAPHIQRLSLIFITEPCTQGGSTTYRPPSRIPLGAETYTTPHLSLPHDDGESSLPSD